MRVHWPWPSTSAIATTSIRRTSRNSLDALRVQHARPGGPAPDMEETRNVVHLVAIAAFGDALIGKRMRAGAKDEAAARERFESWLGQMIETYLRAKA